jgi:hypothetical protein
VAGDGSSPSVAGFSIEAQQRGAETRAAEETQPVEIGLEIHHQEVVEARRTRPAAASQHDMGFSTRTPLVAVRCRPSSRPSHPVPDGMFTAPGLPENHPFILSRHGTLYMETPLLIGRAGIPFCAALFIGNVVSVALLNWLVP